MRVRAPLTPPFLSPAAFRPYEPSHDLLELQGISHETGCRAVLERQTCPGCDQRHFHEGEGRIVFQLISEQILRPARRSQSTVIGVVRGIETRIIDQRTQKDWKQKHHRHRLKLLPQFLGKQTAWHRHTQNDVPSNHSAFPRTRM